MFDWAMAGAALLVMSTWLGVLGYLILILMAWIAS
jgi:hypothetical protein